MGDSVEIREEVINLLLVDDHALFRESLAGMLSSEAGFRVRHCGSIREALEAITQGRYEVVLLDHDLGGERASQFLPAARQGGFEGRVIVVTAWVSDTEARRLLRQGVAGIIFKQTPLKDMVESVRTVAAGGELPEGTWSRPAAETAADLNTAPLFNERHRKVLQFVVEGLSNKEIAWRLQISESYVKAILQSLFQKTGVRTRGQLVRVAFEQYEDQL